MRYCVFGLWPAYAVCIFNNKTKFCVYLVCSNISYVNLPENMLYYVLQSGKENKNQPTTDFVLLKISQIFMKNTFLSWIINYSELCSNFFSFCSLYCHIVPVKCVHSCFKVE